MDDDKPPLIVNILIVLALMGFLAWIMTDMVFADNESVSINDCFISSNKAYIIENRELINCLIQHESGGKTNAVGDQGRANGILQFHIPTFQHFCIEKYELAEEIDQIYNEHIQVMCADMMISEGGISHWTTYPNCYGDTN